MSIVVGVMLFLLTCLFGESFLRGSLPAEEDLAQAWEYLFWMRFTILLLPLQTLLGAAVQSDGDGTVSIIATAVQGIGNIVCSIVLCHFMGIRGIGLASFLFYAVSILILLVHFTKKSNSLRWNLHFSLDILKKVVRFSIIDASSYLFLAILTAALSTFVNVQYGAEFLIVVSVVTLTRELQLLFEGIGEAVDPILSVYIGEENHDGLRFIYKLARKSAIVEGIVLTAVLALIAPLVPPMLNVTDPELVRWIETGMRLIALGSAFMSLLYLITSYYLVINQILLGTVICALRDVAVSAGLAIVLGKIFGLTGMFIGLAAAPALTYALLLLMITARYGKRDCPLLLSRVPGSEQTRLFHLAVEPEQIISLRKKVEALQLENGVDRRAVGWTSLMIEELYKLVYEKNKGKQVLGELTVSLRPEGVQLICKDDGVLFDISEEDLSVTSITSYVVSSYMEKLGNDKRYLTTMSYNRSSFMIKYSK